MDEVLVIDIGGTKTNISFVKNENSKIGVLSSDIISTPVKAEIAISEIASVYNSKEKKVSSISLSLPGRWDKKGVLGESFNLKEWINFPFVESLSKILKIKNCIWETDVICGALGEYYALGEMLQEKSLLYINLGTGIGASLIKNGKPFKSETGLTLRVQKMVVSFKDELNSAVDLISGNGLCKASGYSSVEHLYSDYKLRKAKALNIISYAQTQLASWLINLYYLFSPYLIVLDGGLTNDWEVLASEAVRIANSKLGEGVKILPGKLREQAPIYGAYVNFLNHQAKRVMSY